MNKLLSTAVVSAAFLALPAQAHEVGILIDKQVGESHEAIVSNLGAVKIDAVKPTGFGIRGAYTLLNLKVAEIGLTGTYHFEAKDDLTANTLGISAKVGEYKTSYFAVGAQADWKFLVNLHAGLEIRRESLKSEWIGGDSSSTTYTRPWAKVGIGFSIPAPVVKPFARLEFAYALKTADELNGNSSDDDFNKAMAPKFQIALYGGIRF